MLDLFDINSNWFLLIIAVAVGLVLIIFGGDFFVDSAIWMAKITHIPEMIIGATIVSLGTTLPEILVSFMASANGQVAMAVGNATGSIVCNFALILAITLMAGGSLVNKKEFLSKSLFLVVAVILLTIFSVNGLVSFWESLILFFIFVAFMGTNIAVNIIQNKHNPKQPDKSYKDKKPWVMIILFFVGIAGIAFGANLLVDSVSAVAAKCGISEQIISLTIVAVGTSLPELVTAITSLRKKNTNISMGNIIGANLLNATLITGGSGLIAHGLTINPSDKLSLFVSFAIIFTCFIILLVPIMIKGKTYKWMGFTMFGIYVAYLIFLILQVLGVLA